MILKGNQRAGGSQLALHLMNVKDNDHVTVHELRGFISDNLHGAMNEAYAISRGTKCKQFLFSLSLNPPETKSVSIDVFEAALSDIEAKLGLTNQPRVIVFHEKEGRRHAHCVWSRISIDELKAINLPHYKLKLRDISRKLYLEHEWKMPRGLLNSEKRDPLNFTLEEWQKAKRAGFDPQKVKGAIQDAWAVSDSASTFSYALRERGLWLARGDRSGHVAVDIDGNIFAVSKAVDVKVREVLANLGEADQLPTVQSMQAEIATAVAEKFQTFTKAQNHKFKEVEQSIEDNCQALVKRQRHARKTLSDKQTSRQIEETKERASHLPSGLKALWFRVTGAYQKIKRESENETAKCRLRDQVELAALIQNQLIERRDLRTHSWVERKLYSEQLKDLFDEFASRQLQLSPNSSLTERPFICRKRSPDR